MIYRRISGRLILTIIYSSFFTITAWADEPAEINLLEVNVEGNSVTSSSIIRYTSGLTEGSVVAETDFPKAVKRLWKTGIFSDIQIRLDSETEDGISITIIMRENPILGKLKIHGNKKIRTKSLEEKLNLVSGQRLTPAETTKIIKQISDIYQEEGYLEAAATVSLVPQDGIAKSENDLENPTRDLVIEISEGRKIKTQAIEFTGNKQFSDSRLRRVLKETKQQRWYLFWRTGFNAEKFNEDLDALAVFYRNKGHRDFIIESDSTIIDSDNGRLTVIIAVSEGPVYKYRNITWEGNQLFSDQVLGKALGLKTGAVQSEEEFNLALYERMQGVYMDRGYLYSQIQPQFSLVGEDSLDVHFIISENHQVKVNQINIVGNFQLVGPGSRQLIPGETDLRAIELPAIDRRTVTAGWGCQQQHSRQKSGEMMAHNYPLDYFSSNNF